MSTEIGLILLSVAALAAAAGLGVVAYRWHRRLVVAEPAARRCAALGAGLAVAPVGCMIFPGKAGPAECSAPLAAMLDLQPSDAADLAALCRPLDPEDAASLQAAVEGMRTRGEAFALTVRRADAERVFDVVGRRSGPGGELEPSEILWFSDVTEASRAQAAAQSADRDRCAG